MWELCLFPTPCACYLRRVLLTGSDSELEESWSVSSMSCWLVRVGMLSRAWWRSLALPNLRLSYNTARRRTTNTERAIPVKGSCVAEIWPGKQCPLLAPSLGTWHRWQNSIFTHSLFIHFICLSYLHCLPTQPFPGRVGWLECGFEIRKSNCLEKPEAIYYSPQQQVAQISVVTS